MAASIRATQNVFREAQAAYIGGYEAAKAQFLKARDADLQMLRHARDAVRERKDDAAALHFDLALRRLTLPSFIPREWTLRFEPQTKTLLVEHRFPETARLELFKIVHQVRGTVRKPASQTARRTLIPKIHPSLCLQLARALAEADIFNFVDAIAVNGWVSFFERTTGHPKRAYCSRLISQRWDTLARQLLTKLEAGRLTSNCDAGSPSYIQREPLVSIAAPAY